VQSEKVMITIVWNPIGFHLIKLCRKGFNPTRVITSLKFLIHSVWRGTQIGRTNRKLIVHAHNARTHTGKVTLDFMERNAAKRAPHPPCSPDLAPSDFYLFGHVKQLLILRVIEKMILEDVFLSEMERLRQCGIAAGEYVESTKLLREENFSAMVSS
jgi:hypothetical protein